MSNSSVKTAIIPAAGLGTRFLPTTYSLPKELLPILGRPAIEYVLEELLEAGIEKVCLVLHPTKDAVFDHFQSGGAIEDMLRARGKLDMLGRLLDLRERLTFVKAYQDEPLGLGHAVLCGAQAVEDDHFVVALPDDLVVNEPGATAQLISAHQAHGHSVLALERVHRDKISSYGILAGKALGAKDFLGETIVEKPDPDQAPSNLGIVGRYILSRGVFHHLEKGKKGRLGEIQLTDAIADLAASEGVVGHVFDGQRLDTGQPKGFVHANVVMGCRDETIRAYLSQAFGEVAPWVA